MDLLIQLADEPRVAHYEDWLDWCRMIKARFPICGSEYYQKTDYVDAYAFFDKLSHVLPPDVLIVPGSSGTGFSTSHQVFRVKSGQRFFSSKGLAAMGYGLPSSIGACLASDRKETVTVIGNGGFQLNIQELATVRGNQLPIKIFVFNNQGYLSIRTTQDSYFNGVHVGSDVASGVWIPPLDRIANAYDIPFARICNMRTLDEDIRSVLSMSGPVLCEVMLDPQKAPFPKLASRKRPDGQMESNPLEEMVPALPAATLKECMLIPLWSERGNHEH
jgi:acetolactate synthase-1/2/3 large subunit